MSLPGIFSLPVKVTVASAPDSYVPPTEMQDLLEAIPKFTSYELDDTGANVVINSDGAGATFDGVFVWMLGQHIWPPWMLTGYRNGWWQVYTGKPGEIRMFAGSPAGFFDSSGLGVEARGWDGWALCNGQNGTFNLQNYFIVPGYRWDGLGGAGWVIQLDPGPGPGLGDQYYYAVSFYQRITLANLPQLMVNVNGTNFFKYTSTGSGGLFIGDAPGLPGGGAPPGTNVAYYPYQIDQNPYLVDSTVNLAPPYIALGYVQFVGYL